MRRARNRNESEEVQSLRKELMKHFNEKFDNLRCHIDQRMRKIELAIKENSTEKTCAFNDDKIDILNEVDRTAMFFKDETELLKGDVSRIEKKLDSCINEQKELWNNVENLNSGLEDLTNVVQVIEERQRQDEVERNEILESVEELREENDSLQQYGRRETLVIHNVPKKEKEDTLQVALTFISYELGMNIRPEFVSTCHRNYPPKNTYAPSCPPIYIKFTIRDLKRDCLRRKMRLKESSKESTFTSARI